MLSIQFVRENPDLVRDALQKRQDSAPLDEILSLDRQRRELLADVAHELRTPLTVVQGNLEGLRDGVYDATPEHLDLVLDETHKLGRLVEICTWLRDDPATSYDFLVDVTAAHWPEDPQPIEMIYHLYSHSRNDRLRLKTRAADRGPVPTLTGIWKSADWNEREAYDMFGIRFEGHPDLRRILMPEDYTDFPLRKEFPLFRG